MNFLYVIAGIALTALCWGSYGPVLHEGQHHLGNDRIKPLICVGLAYFVVAVIIPMILLSARGSLGTGWTFTGFSWSFAAGTAGTFGAFGIILALTNGGKPWMVMPLVFGFAPIVTTIVSLTTKGLWDKASPVFFAGIILVVAGAVIVLLFAPRGKPEAKKEVEAKQSHPLQSKPKAVPDEAETE